MPNLRVCGDVIRPFGDDATWRLCCSICGIDQPRHVGHAHTFVAMHAMLRSATAIASTATMSFPETAERVRRLPPTGQDRRDVLS
jgi:hypothetical protein